MYKMLTQTCSVRLTPPNNVISKKPVASLLWSEIFCDEFCDVFSKSQNKQSASNDGKQDHTILPGYQKTENNKTYGNIT